MVLRVCFGMLGAANAYPPHRESSLEALVKACVLSAARGVGEFPTLVARLVVGSDRALHSILIEAIGAYYSGNVRAIEAFLVGYLTAGKFWDKNRKDALRVPVPERRLSNDKSMELLLEEYPRLPERIIAMDLGVSYLETTLSTIRNTLRRVSSWWQLAAKTGAIHLL